MNIVKEIALELKKSGISTGSVEAETILTSILGCRKADLYTEDIELEPYQAELLKSMVMRRIKGEPLQYIIGTVYFYNSLLFTAPGVFIPRPETEILVETVINSITNEPTNQRTKEHLSVLDLCTGSGNIGIALTKEFSHCKIISSDISKEALGLAKRNALINCVIDRMEFVKSDLFKGLDGYLPEGFDLIVANPPYIASRAINTLPEEVRREPRQALDGGADGTDFYLGIVEESPRFLKRGGLITLELGDGLAEKVKEMLERSLCFDNIRLFKDLNGTERVIAAVLTK